MVRPDLGPPFCRPGSHLQGPPPAHSLMAIMSPCTVCGVVFICGNRSLSIACSFFGLQSHTPQHLPGSS